MPSLATLVPTYLPYWSTYLPFCLTVSVTRLGDLLHLGQHFKASGKNYFAQIAHILAIFVKVSKSFIFLVQSFLGNFYIHLATFSGHTSSNVFWHFFNRIFQIFSMSHHRQLIRIITLRSPTRRHIKNVVLIVVATFVTFVTFFRDDFFSRHGSESKNIFRSKNLLIDTKNLNDATAFDGTSFDVTSVDKTTTSLYDLTIRRHNTSTSQYDVSNEVQGTMLQNIFWRNWLYAVACLCLNFGVTMKIQNLHHSNLHLTNLHKFYSFSQRIYL